MDIKPDTKLLDDALNEIAQISQYVPEPQSHVEKRKLLASIRELSNDALLAFTSVEHQAIVEAAKATSDAR